ncbi:MAG: DUF255 domain-containing protein [Candidatus Methylomirabilales bacterium]
MADRPMGRGVRDGKSADGASMKGVRVMTGWRLAGLLLVAWGILGLQSARAEVELYNRLANATSPYLREAAGQPVHWQPWGEEAFRLAKEMDRPILLDIGAVWCHWCHVMDEETYTNPEVAKLINEYFVPIKVDRDERPDIDIRYQTQVRALTGFGGWPLTVFMTPEGKVFYGGGTFFPERRHGRPGLTLLLPKLYLVYRREKDNVLQTAEGLYQAVAEYEARFTRPGDLSRGLIEATQLAMLRTFDETYGGFGKGVKFPIAGTVALALKGYSESGDQNLLRVATKTLDAMARGGVYDQLGGGFHRYAVDRQWRVPHFEKMLSDQAQLLKDYLEVYQVTGNDRYRQVAEGIIRYVQGSLSDQSRGGFYAHQDADMGRQDDGDYYTWTEKEIRQGLPKEQAQVIIRYFDIGPRGEMRENPARNVLWIARTPTEVAEALQMPVPTVKSLIAEGERNLLAERKQRKAPFVDPTILSDRNGLMISAYLEAYKVLGREELKVFALKSLDFLLNHAYVPEKGIVHAYVNGKATVPGFLRDQVQIAAALLDAFEVTGEVRYLAAARDIMRYTLKAFWDETGGFFDTPPDRQALGVLDLRTKPIEDHSTPGQNSVAAEVLSRLYYLTNQQEYRRRAKETLRTFAGGAQRLGINASTYAFALGLYLDPPAHAVIIGGRSTPETRALWRAALRAYRPAKIVAAYDPDDVSMGSLPPAVAAAVKIGRQDRTAKAYVCVGPSCSLPTSDPKKVTELVMNFGKKPRRPVTASLPGTRVPDMGHDHIPSVNTSHAPYNSDPPTSGPHVRRTAEWGIYDQPVPKELLVHNLEHGGVIIHYNCDCPEFVKKLAAIAKRYDGRQVILAPYPGMDHKIALTAWTRIDKFNEFDEERIVRFIAAYIGIDHHQH